MGRRADRQAAEFLLSSYRRRLLTTGAAYQFADIASKVFALALLPVYTRELSRADYGTAELVLTTIIFVSILLRLGLGEAYVRFHFHDEDAARRGRLARTATGTLLLITTAAAIPAALAAEPISQLLLDRSDPAVIRAGVLGLWAFTNLELAYAQLRVEERKRAYLLTSLANVLLTVALTVTLVVFLDQGDFGLVLGNYAASAVVLLGLWWVLRERLRPGAAERGEGGLLRRMLRFGLPTVPAELSVFALFFVDRLYLYKASGAAAAGLYALAVKLAGAVIFSVRAFQLAWPPLIYSITEDREAARVYARVTTYYVLFSGLVVAGLTLLGRWIVRLLAAPKFFEAHEALPWVALGWALYGLYLVFVTLAGRAGATVRIVPAALAGLAANVVALLLLTGPLGIAGVGIALCIAYAVVLLVVFVLVRDVLPVAYEWRRLAWTVLVLGATTVVSELLLPTDGTIGFVSRSAVLVALLLCLLPLRLLTRAEFDAFRRMSGKLRPVSQR